MSDGTRVWIVRLHRRSTRTDYYLSGNGKANRLLILALPMTQAEAEEAAADMNLKHGDVWHAIAEPWFRGKEKVLV